MGQDQGRCFPLEPGISVPLSVPRVFLVMTVAILLTGCASRDPRLDHKLQTRSEANSDSLEGAVSSPLRDLNLIRAQVPTALTAAMAMPYAPPKPMRCDMISAQVRALNDVLGPDLDVAPVEKTLSEQGTGTALGLLAGVTSGVIPYRSWIRKLTGAERHDALIGQAITAGTIRRAYLKGLGDAAGCPPPAAPLPLLHLPPVGP